MLSEGEIDDSFKQLFKQLAGAVSARRTFFSREGEAMFDGRSVPSLAKTHKQARGPPSVDKKAREDENDLNELEPR